MARHRSAKAYPILLALVSAALFGAATPASKALLENLSAFQLAGLLYLGAAIAMAGSIIRRRSRLLPWRMDRRNRLRLAGAVGFGGVLGPVLLLAGLRLASAASVSLWLNLELVATAALGHIVFKDHLGRYGWIGVVGVLGAGMILAWEGGPAGLWAGLLVAAACTCWGMDNHLTALIDGITPAQSTFWKGIVAGVVNLAIGMALAPLVGGMLGISLALVVGAFSYGISIMLYISAAQGIGATRAQLFFASAPFFGLALSAWTLGEPISLVQIVAAIIFAVSVLILFRDQHAHEHEHEPLIHEHMHRHDDQHHTHVHPGLPASHRHSHRHEHEAVTHSHPHWPDLHHRHAHN